MHIANASVWATMAITLATCDLVLIEDGIFSGPLTPDRLYTAGPIRCVDIGFIAPYANPSVSSHPKPFSCKIMRRSPKTTALLWNTSSVYNERQEYGLDI